MSKRDPIDDYPVTRWDAEMFGKLAKYMGLDGRNAAALIRNGTAGAWDYIHRDMKNLRWALKKSGLLVEVEVKPFDPEVSTSWYYTWTMKADRTLATGEMQVKFFETKTTVVRTEVKL